MPRVFSFYLFFFFELIYSDFPLKWTQKLIIIRKSHLSFLILNGEKVRVNEEKMMTWKICMKSWHENTHASTHTDTHFNEVTKLAIYKPTHYLLFWIFFIIINLIAHLLFQVYIHRIGRLSLAPVLSKQQQQYSCHIFIFNSLNKITRKQRKKQNERTKERASERDREECI